jgi:hypothetical protein
MYSELSKIIRNMLNSYCFGMEKGRYYRVGLSSRKYFEKKGIGCQVLGVRINNLGIANSGI